MRNMLKNRRGQGMTEYIIIVGLIAILLIGAVQLFKNEVGGAFGAAQNKIKSDVTDPINTGSAGGGGAPAAGGGGAPAPGGR